MSRYRDYGYRDHDFYPESQPIATDKGLKARSKRGGFTENWWAKRWIEALEKLMDTNRLRRGRRYARQGQVLSIEERSGGVAAEVQGSRKRPYRVEVELQALTDEQWKCVTETLSERTLFTARLLAGEMPEDIEEAFSAAGVGLFPERRNELRTSCSCPDSAKVCKHTAAVHYILGEQFDEDPFLLFRLRGRTEEQLKAALREQAQHASGDIEDTAGTEPLARPLEEELDRFWEAGSQLDSVKTSIKPPAVGLSVLRRLGQPGFVDEDLVSLLAPGYRAVSDETLEMALGKEEEQAGDDQASEEGV